MPSTIAVVENHCVTNKLVVPRRERVLCIINQTPKEAFTDKETLIKIRELTKKFNQKVLENKKPAYIIELKEIKENDYDVYQKLCNEVLKGEAPVETFPTTKAFVSWYQTYLKEDVAKKVDSQKSMNQYVSSLYNKK